MRRQRDLIIYCDRASNAATELSRRLNCRRVVGNPNRKLLRTDGALVVNYGTSHPPAWSLGNKAILINPPDKVRDSISKVKSYERFKEAGVPTLEFTSSHDEALGWKETGRVLARRDGLSSGEGVSIWEPGGGNDSCRKSDFYTKYFPKTHEYRVHVFKQVGGLPTSDGNVADPQRGTTIQSYRVIDITQKKRSVEGSNDESEGSGRTLYQRVVRSLDNGWVHAHSEVHLPPEAKKQIEAAAVGAVNALGLDFGAVDILAKYSKKHPEQLRQLAVCEVNTAPGLGNEVTIKAYTDAVRGLYEATRSDRYVPVRRRVRKLVPVTFRSRKGNMITRMRYRRVYEQI